MIENSSREPQLDCGQSMDTRSSAPPPLPFLERKGKEIQEYCARDKHILEEKETV